jgi:hypothetical protein
MITHKASTIKNHLNLSYITRLDEISRWGIFYYQFVLDMPDQSVITEITKPLISVLKLMRLNSLHL